jgi:glycine/D-amino acid oxidase-like deaminating enzyme
MKPRRVAVVGAGIMGSATALLLARRGVDVVLYDAAEAPFSGASRWNEGKIHLGFLYSADPSLRTAERLIPAGLAFRPLLEELLGVALEGVTQTDDVFLVHRDSVVDPAAISEYYAAVANLIRAVPGGRGYLADVSAARVRQLAARDLEEIADPRTICAGFMVPERSISTQWVADRFVDALNAEPRVEQRPGTRVLGVDRDARTGDGPFHVRSHAQTDGGFDAVVNAAWEGRPRLDRGMGIAQDHPWTHRYRVALFIETDDPAVVPSAVICTGPFGDVKNYNGRAFYASWYRTGLLASGEAVDPPPVPLLSDADRAGIADEVFEHLGAIVPPVRGLQSKAKTLRVEGGWVFARGRGDLGNPAATLHRRDRIGITRSGSYFSVDTGKYSLGPWLALQVADAIAPRSATVSHRGLAATG